MGKCVHLCIRILDIATFHCYHLRDPLTAHPQNKYFNGFPAAA